MGQKEWKIRVKIWMIRMNKCRKSMARPKTTTMIMTNSQNNFKATLNNTTKTTINTKTCPRSNSNKMNPILNNNNKLMPMMI